MDPERTLAPSPFPDDAGQATSTTRQALATAGRTRSPNDYLRAVAALCLDRVLVPVVATATRLGQSGQEFQGGQGRKGDHLVRDKEAEMSVVLLQTAEGERALLAFTGMDSLQAWSAEARPVPVTLDLAAQSARADCAAALLVDFAGPHPLVIEADVLGELAQGHRLVEFEAGGFGWAVAADPDRDDASRE